MHRRRNYTNVDSITMHRRTEMKRRIEDLFKTCNEAIYYIKKLKVKAQGFLNEGQCEPEEQIHHFLTCMNQLDEYKYIMTAFNINITNFDGIISSVNSPVQDVNMLTPQPVNIYNSNLIDILSEPVPSTSRVCTNNCPPKELKKKRGNSNEQLLIAFSNSTSPCSSIRDLSSTFKENDLVNMTANLSIQHTPSQTMSFVTEVNLEEHTTTVEEDATQRNDSNTRRSATENNIINVDVSQRNVIKENHTHSSNSNESNNVVNPAITEYNLPEQTLLSTDLIYSAVILQADGGNFYAAIENIDEITKYLTEMTDKYICLSMIPLTADELVHCTYCAYYDDKSTMYYRALVIRIMRNNNTATVFLVDTGMIRETSLSFIYYLLPEYHDRPPLAYCCHLAGIDSTWRTNRSLINRHDQFMKQYIGVVCSIAIEDNTSGSWSSFVILPTKEVLNDLIADIGIKPVESESSYELEELFQSQECPLALESAVQIEEDPLDITNEAETDDPLIAVSGYHNRDEAEICKHYYGGPKNVCFKGNNCKKRHVLIHPNGWTLDRVEVPACQMKPLPPPGQYIEVQVTHVCHYDRMYVHIVDQKHDISNYREISYLHSLEGLVMDMNRPQQCNIYKPMSLEPAPGEIVAALYPYDSKWYRARVLATSGVYHTVQVQYIDYGNVYWIPEKNIRELPLRYSSVPVYAVIMRIAEVVPKKNNNVGWLEVQKELTNKVHNKQLRAYVLADEYNELVVHAYDEEGYNVAEQLAALGLTELRDFRGIAADNVVGGILPA